MCNPTPPPIPSRPSFPLPTTPVRVSSLAAELRSYPDQPFVAFLIEGFSKGFSIGYKGPLISHRPLNLRSAIDHPDVIDTYIAAECCSGHTAGPFPAPPFPSFNVSPLGAVPKKHSGKWRLILNLSNPPHGSVNDGIPLEEFTFKYISVDTASDAIMKLGRGCSMAKIDVKSAFRICPVNPADWPLLGFQWNGAFYYDRVLPFGLRSAPYIFNCFAESLCWILSNNYSIAYIMHYLDDFLTLGVSEAECSHNVDLITGLFTRLGIPIAEEKQEGPSTVLTFLGITLDSTRLEARLPPDKLASIKSAVSAWLTKPEGSKRELLSLIGLLSFAAKVVPPGRSFLRRMLDLAHSQPLLDSTVTLTDPFFKDLHWWHSFLESWNGRSFLMSPRWLPNSVLRLFTDSSGSIGYGAYFQGHWFNGRWPQHVLHRSIQWKELFPIVLAAATWGPQWSTKRILFLSDNEAVVAALSSGTSHSPDIMSLIRTLHFCAAKHNFTASAKHVPGTHNSIADALSRFHMQVFRQLAPEADLLPTPPAQLPSVNI